jgi:uncharacterized protein (TIGR03435 family)
MLQRAYRGIVAGEIVGLPDWARRDGYDVNATSTLASASQEDRSAMMRAMLRERFGLLAHLERRPQPTLVLLPARPDGRLGTGLTKIDADCAKQEAERAAATRATGGLPALPDRSQPWPSCLLRLTSGPDGSTRIEGEGTLASLIQLLRIETRGVLVVDQSGVPGSFRVGLTYQVERGALAAAAEPPTGPDFTTALREQLGLKLDSVRIERDTLVVDRIERPTEN